MPFTTHWKPVRHPLSARPLFAALSRPLSPAPSAIEPGAGRGSLAGVDAASIGSRRARATAGDAQARTAATPAGSRAAGSDPSAASPPSAGAACCRAGGGASTSRPARSTNPRAERTTTGAWRAPWRAAGFESGELVHNCFSYHLTPGAWMMDSGAQALGCKGSRRRRQHRAAARRDCRPAAHGLHGHARLPQDPAREGCRGRPRAADPQGAGLGEAFPPSLRDWLAERGVAGYQCYATADCGLIAYETEAREGLVVDEGVIVEIVRPGTGDPVPDGEVGEVVVTVLNPDYPLIRFGTGDLSAVLPGPCPSGRSNIRIRGWLGRADQTTKVRGMFVHRARSPRSPGAALMVRPARGWSSAARWRATRWSQGRAWHPSAATPRWPCGLPMDAARRHQAARRDRAVRDRQPAQRRQVIEDARSCQVPVRGRQLRCMGTVVREGGNSRSRLPFRGVSPFEEELDDAGEVQPAAALVAVHRVQVARASSLRNRRA